MVQDSHRRAAAACPRCRQPVHEPTAWSSAWRCDLRDPGQDLDLPFGAPSPRLPAS